MPYIKPEKRDAIAQKVEFVSFQVDDPGEINYAITKFIHYIIKRKGISYALLNSLIGVLECTKLELYRMVAAPYEDKKRIENGPVSELDTNYDVPKL